MSPRSRLTGWFTGPWLSFEEHRPPRLLHVIFVVTLLFYATTVGLAHMAGAGPTAPTTLLAFGSLAVTAALWPFLPWTSAASPPRKSITVLFLLASLGLLAMSGGQVTPLVIFVAAGNAVVVLRWTGAVAAASVPMALAVTVHLVGGNGLVRALSEGAVLLLFCAISVLAFTALTVSRRETRRTAELLEELRTAHAELRRRAERSRELTVAEERARMAREMHDSVGHYLTVINMGLTNARRYRDARTEEDAWREVAEAQELTQEALADTRRWVRALKPLKLEGRAGTEAMRALAASFGGSGIEVVFDAASDLPALGESAELVLYRALQEGLTNAARHSGASSVRVRLANSVDGGDEGDDGGGGDAGDGGDGDGGGSRHGGVELRIRDNGAGTDLDSPTSGLGLRGLRERAEAIGGALSAGGLAAGGFELRVTVPVRRDTATEVPA